MNRNTDGARDVSLPGRAASTASPSGKIWIDLDNSPHVPFFAPIIEELHRRGHSILLTARDCFQVCELADLLNLPYRRVGRHYGRHILWKMAGLCRRAMQLAPIVMREKPLLALSHGSRSQLLLANVLAIPSVTIADYEFARIWMLVHPTWVITPEVIPDDSVDTPKARVLKYPGIKEDVYVSRFEPAPGILEDLGINARELIVTARPPATEAHYHRPESDELFAGVIDFLGSKPQVKVVLLPRNGGQADWIRSKWTPLFSQGRIVIPDRVVDGLNLIWHSDLVISGGGTMNREAAALGIPVYSIFRGKIGAVDRYLASCGRLTILESLQDIKTRLVLAKRSHPVKGQKSQSTALWTIVKHITTILAESSLQSRQAR